MSHQTGPRLVEIPQVGGRQDQDQRDHQEVHRLQETGNFPDPDGVERDGQEPDGDQVPELEDEGQDLADQTDGVGSIPLPDDGGVEDAHGLGVVVLEDGVEDDGVAEELDAVVQDSVQ